MAIFWDSFFENEASVNVSVNELADFIDDVNDKLKTAILLSMTCMSSLMRCSPSVLALRCLMMIHLPCGQWRT